MGDVAEAYDDEGFLVLELHERGECNEIDCPYCREEESNA